MTLYEQVVNLAEDYLGPAADRFIERQVVFHLKKKPQELTEADLSKLQEWVKVSLGLLTEDHLMVDDFEAKLANLRKHNG